jgi:hypothetical protein
VTGAAPVLERLVGLTRWRALRPTVDQLMDLVTELGAGSRAGGGGRVSR